MLIGGAGGGDVDDGAVALAAGDCLLAAALLVADIHARMWMAVGVQIDFSQRVMVLVRAAGCLAAARDAFFQVLAVEEEFHLAVIDVIIKIEFADAIWPEQGQIWRRHLQPETSVIYFSVLCYSGFLPAVRHLSRHAADSWCAGMIAEKAQVRRTGYLGEFIFYLGPMVSNHPCHADGMKIERTNKIPIHALNFPPTTFARFGAASLVRYFDAPYELVGGTPEDCAAAHELCLLFAPEVVFSGTPRHNPVSAFVM